MRALLILCTLVITPACAIAFGAGMRPAPAPSQFQDVESTKKHEQKEMTVHPPTITPGMSLVIGGDRIDSGKLPPPPVPIAPPL